MNKIIDFLIPPFLGGGNQAISLFCHPAHPPPHPPFLHPSLLRVTGAAFEAKRRIFHSPAKPVETRNLVLKDRFFVFHACLFVCLFVCSLPSVFTDVLRTDAHDSLSTFSDVFLLISR